MSRPGRFPAPGAPGSAPPANGNATTNDVPQISTAQLFRGGNEVLIEHRGERYRLRLTRQDRLILTK